LRVLSLS
jgi:hypothetical protein